jgi:4-hydroxybenzoyl-CoA reductase alpha subunit
MSGQHRVVGQRHRKIDGRAKATGRARYTADLSLPGMLHAKILRSPYASARIRGIDTSAAEVLDGVHGVITGADLPETYGIIVWTRDEHPLCVDRASYVGDGVAAVAAETVELAELACRRIKVDYEPLEPVLSFDDAIARPQDAVRPGERAEKHGNVTKSVTLSFGDVDGGLRTADVRVEGEYSFENTNHVSIEPHAALADYDAAAGVLTLWSCTQVPHYLHRELSRVLGLDQSRIRVVQPAIGAGFGGKSEPFDLEFVVSKLAMVTGRPVRLVYSREEVFLAHRGRHPMRMRFEVGARRDGTITAVRARNELDGGAYSSFGLVTTYYSGQLLPAPVKLGAYEFSSTRVFTNKPACGAKRGHGSVQPRFAFECMLDEVADAIGMDPIELRRRHDIGSNVRTINGQRITSNGMVQCLDAVERTSGWKEKFRKLGRGRGIGVATSMYITGTNYPIYPNEMPQSSVTIKADRSGRVTVLCGASDIGQGSDSALAVIVAEVLGLDLADIAVRTQDTDLCPVDLGSYSSRVTFMCGNAALDAARQIEALLRKHVAAEWACAPDDLVLDGSRVFLRQDTGRSASFADAVWLAEAAEGPLVRSGGYKTPKLGGDYRGGTIGASPAYSFTAHVAEVVVDEATGFVEVVKVWAAHDCGTAINPTIVEGQVQGSVYMGLGEALLEAQVYDEKGRLTCPNLVDYKVPTAVDTPEIEAIVVESHDPEGPFGAKEAGEGPLHPIIPAIANAIHDAVGIRLRQIPFHPARVLAAIEASREVVK